jgi:hypothetical protein
MSWPDATREPVSRLLVRSRAVALVVDDFTGQPPAVPPAMRLQRLLGDAVVELDWRPTVTLGDAVVFGALDDLGGTPAAERYRLLVDADDALRPDQPDGYALDVPADPASWPVQVAVRLLPGPGYAFTPHLPVVRGLVLEPGPELQPVRDAVVAASEDDGATVSSRCGADHRGSFSLGLPTYRASRTTVIQATAPDGAVTPWRALVAKDFETSVHLTVRR